MRLCRFEKKVLQQIFRCQFEQLLLQRLKIIRFNVRLLYDKLVASWIPVLFQLLQTSTNHLFPLLTFESSD